MSQGTIGTVPTATRLIAVRTSPLISAKFFVYIDCEEEHYIVLTDRLTSFLLIIRVYLSVTRF